MLLYSCDSSNVVYTTCYSSYSDYKIHSLIHGSLYTGLNFTWQCDVDLPGDQLAGVSAAVVWRRPNGDIMTSDNRITVGGVVESSPGHSFQSSVMFSPLSAGDSGSYSCSATAMPTVMNSNVMNGVRTGNDSLSLLLVRCCECV